MGYLAKSFYDPDPTQNDADYLLVKLNSSLGNEWQNNYGGSRHDIGYCVLQADDGGYALFGHADLYDNENAVFCFIKSDDKGSMRSKK